MKRKLTNYEIRQYWKEEANVGIITGEISKLAVLDFDDRDSYNVFKEVWSNLYPDFLLDTMTVQTGKGVHVYFRPDVHARTTTFRFNDNLHHLKQEGGYVVAPPSIHPSGSSYVLVGGFNVEPQDIKGRMVIDTLKAMGVEEPSTQRKDRPATWASALCEPISQGERNTSAAQLCGLLIRKFPYDEGLIMGLMKAWNSMYCNPPLDEDEIFNLVEGEIARYGPQERKEIN